MKLPLACLLSAVIALAAAGSARAGPQPDLEHLLHRVDRYLERQEQDGVTRDPREPSHPSESVRITVVCQLLGYCELDRSSPGHYRRDLEARADWLVQNSAAIRTNTAFDGMLGYALLRSYQQLGDPRYFVAAIPVVNTSMSLLSFQNTLNWGLMSAMTLAQYYQITADPVALEKVNEILRSVEYFQNEDGSFPHYCRRSRDVHYTAWMAQELIAIERLAPSPDIDRMLCRTNAFLKSRVRAGDVTSYADECGCARECWISYYGTGSGCLDYDTRGWSNELGYSAVIFARFGDSPALRSVLERLEDLEIDGGFPDKWGYPPDPTDPALEWALGNPSVARSSILFWSLAMIESSSPSLEPATPVCPAPPEFPVLLERRCREECQDGGCEPGLAGARSIAAALDGETTSSFGEAFAAELDSTLAPDLDRRVDPHLYPVDVRMLLSHERRSGRGAATDRIATGHADAAGTIGEPATIEVFDILGRTVRSFASAAPEDWRRAWDSRDDSGARAVSGVYFVVRRTSRTTETMRVVVLR